MCMGRGLNKIKRMKFELASNLLNRVKTLFLSQITIQLFEQIEADSTNIHSLF